MRTRTHISLRPNAWRIAAALLAAVTLVFATAQDTNATSDAAASAAEAAALRQQALRLELLNELPEEARADATVLLDRVDELRARAQALQTQALEARVAALEAGEPANVAQLLALQAVLDERIALARESEALRNDVLTLVETYPDATAILRYGAYARDLGRVTAAGGFAPDLLGAGMHLGLGRAGRDVALRDRFGDSERTWQMRHRMGGRR